MILRSQPESRQSVPASHAHMYTRPEPEEHLREREAAEPREEEHEAYREPLARARVAQARAVRVEGGGGFGDPGGEGHGREGGDPGVHAEVEHGERAEAPEERGHAELEDDRDCAHAGERAADLRRLSVFNAGRGWIDGGRGGAEWEGRNTGRGGGTT